jgi:small conductance mechanosensitive channel
LRLLPFIGQWLIRILNRWFRKIISNHQFDVTLRPFCRIFLPLPTGFADSGIDAGVGNTDDNFAALIRAIGVAAGLALSGTFQNFASGVLIILLKPF